MRAVSLVYWYFNKRKYTHIWRNLPCIFYSPSASPTVKDLQRRWKLKTIHPRNLGWKKQTLQVMMKMRVLHGEYNFFMLFYNLQNKYSQTRLQQALTEQETGFSKGFLKISKNMFCRPLFFRHLCNNFKLLFFSGIHVLWALAFEEYMNRSLRAPYKWVWLYTQIDYVIYCKPILANFRHL